MIVYFRPTHPDAAHEEGRGDYDTDYRNVADYNRGGGHDQESYDYEVDILVGIMLASSEGEVFREEIAMATKTTEEEDHREVVTSDLNGRTTVVECLQM